MLVKFGVVAHAMISTILHMAIADSTFQRGQEMLPCDSQAAPGIRKLG